MHIYLFINLFIFIKSRPFLSYFFSHFFHASLCQTINNKDHNGNKGFNSLFCVILDIDVTDIVHNTMHNHYYNF